MSNKSVLSDTRRTVKGKSSKAQKRLSDDSRWTYYRTKNYGQLDLPEGTDSLFLLKIKIDSAELLETDFKENSPEMQENEWRVKVDSFGTDLISQTFTFNSEGKYNPKRKHGILIRMRSDLAKFSNFLSESMLRIKIESVQNEEIVYKGEVLIKLSQFLETLTSGMTEKWRRIVRDVKLDAGTGTDYSPDIKLSLLLALCKDNQCFQTADNSPTALAGDNNNPAARPSQNDADSLSYIRTSEEKVSATQAPIPSAPQEDATESQDRKMMSQTLNSCRTRKLRKHKNPRISVGRLTLLSNELEDKNREIERMKESHENEMSALRTKHQQVCDELEILKSKQNTDENRNTIPEKSSVMFDMAVQTENEDMSNLMLNEKEDTDKRQKEMDEKRIRGKVEFLDNLIEEYNTKLNSLNVKTEALKIRDAKTIPRFGRGARNYRETIAKKQETKRLLENNNIFDFIESDLCNTLEQEIRHMEAQRLVKDELMRKQLENEINSKKQLLAKFQSNKKT